MLQKCTFYWLASVGLCLAQAIAPTIKTSLGQIIANLSQLSGKGFNTLEITDLYAPIEPNSNWKKVISYVNLNGDEIKIDEMELLDTSTVYDIDSLKSFSILHTHVRIFTPSAEYTYKPEEKEWFPTYPFNGNLPISPGDQFNATLIKVVSKAFVSTNPMLLQDIQNLKKSLKTLDVTINPDKVAEALDQLKLLDYSPSPVEHKLSYNAGQVSHVFDVLPDGMISSSQLSIAGRSFIHTYVHLAQSDQFTIPSSMIYVNNAPPPSFGNNSIISSQIAKIKGKKILGIQFGLKDGNFVVMDVLPGSAAQKAGLKFPDIVKKINGLSLDGVTLDDVHRLCDRDHVTFSVVSSNGTARELSLDRAVIDKP